MTSIFKRINKSNTKVKPSKTDAIFLYQCKQRQINIIEFQNISYQHTITSKYLRFVLSSFFRDSNPKKKEKN